MRGVSCSSLVVDESVSESVSELLVDDVVDVGLCGLAFVAETALIVLPVVDECLFFWERRTGMFACRLWPLSVVMFVDFDTVDCGDAELSEHSKHYARTT